MAYVRHTPDGFDVVQAENGVFCSSLIGYDDNEDITYSIATSLSRNPTLEHELSFWLVENHGTNASYDIWEGRAAGFLRGQDRRFVLKIAARAIQECMNRLKPRKVVMTTYEDGLPDNALVKYRFIADAIEQIRYRVRESDPYHGKRLWLMERLENS